jgi:hypothetical protein
MMFRSAAPGSDARYSPSLPAPWRTNAGKSTGLHSATCGAILEADERDEPGSGIDGSLSDA